MPDHHALCMGILEHLVQQRACALRAVHGLRPAPVGAVPDHAVVVNHRAGWGGISPLHPAGHLLVQLVETVADVLRQHPGVRKEGVPYLQHCWVLGQLHCHLAPGLEHLAPCGRCPSGRLCGARGCAVPLLKHVGKLLHAPRSHVPKVPGHVHDLVVPVDGVHCAPRLGRLLLQAAEQPHDGELVVPAVQDVTHLHQDGGAADPLATCLVHQARQLQRLERRHEIAVQVPHCHDAAAVLLHVGARRRRRGRRLRLGPGPLGQRFSCVRGQCAERHCSCGGGSRRDGSQVLPGMRPTTRYMKVDMATR
mmetsp:Transcript_48162/g.92071  ORF Transcript_48162/g.92071 Transcript_48162/m.92071 type:complete len:307 (-) Transcript_48162:119-1039(-)